METSGLREDRHQVGGSSLRMITAGPADGRPVLFLHGWPETADAWTQVMSRAGADGRRALAVDLPGIGGSTGDATDQSTRAIADLIAQVITDLGLSDLTVVGHDFGGMVLYPLLRRHPDLLARAVIMDVVIPGVPPWQQVLANPYVWHFAFHAIPGLPETLVQGRERAYFDYFYDALGPPDGSGVSEQARQHYTESYSRPSALQTGFGWYRGLHRDAIDNVEDATGADGAVITLDKPVLYLRGEHEQGDLADYRSGFAEAGLRQVSAATVPEAGHFAAEDNPAEVWRLIAEFS